MSVDISSEIKYGLTLNEPPAHVFQVEIQFPQTEDDYLDIVLPVWRPGRYMIFDFASGVIEFKALVSNSDTQLKWKKVNKTTWRVETYSQKCVTVTYKLYANEFNLRTRGLDENHAFINGTAVFMYSEKFRKNPISLNVTPHKGWHVTTCLENVIGYKNKFLAKDYDYLSDCPLEIGIQKDIEFYVNNKKHTISIFGDVKVNEVVLVKDFIKIVEKNFEFWGFIPYDKFVFIVHCTPESSGGTEHINSTVVGVHPQAFEKESNYKDFLGLISHEFFHTWNVKQLRPKGLTPYDYTHENYTEELWIAEGGTSYYDGLILVRTGQVTLNEFLDDIARSVETDRSKSGNSYQSLAESSFDAWVKFWKFTSQRNDYESNYYLKGANVSLLLDLEIRQRTRNLNSLDDVFRKMLQKYPLGKGYVNEDFMRICDEVTGTDFRLFFEDHVYGTKPLKWEEFISYAGLSLFQYEDKAKIRIGLESEFIDGMIVIKDVLPDSMAFEAGLMSKDEILAVDDKKISFEQSKNLINFFNDRDKIKLTIFRNGILETKTLKKEGNKVKYVLKKISNPDLLQKAIFTKWLELEW